MYHFEEMQTNCLTPCERPNLSNNFELNACRSIYGATYGTYTPSDLKSHAQSWNVLRNSRIVRQRKDSYIALRNARIAQIPTPR